MKKLKGYNSSEKIEVVVKGLLPEYSLCFGKGPDEILKALLKEGKCVVVSYTKEKPK